MMRLLLLLLFTGVTLAQQPCSDCHDPSRPWMRGAIEIACAMTQEDMDRWMAEHPGRQIKRCACQHTCDVFAEHAEETNRRGWDARCEARCNPNGCQCKHPCES